MRGDPRDALEKNMSVRIKKDGRILVLPPIGHGKVWSGGAK